MQQPLCAEAGETEGDMLCGESKAESGSEVSAWQRKHKMHLALEKKHNKKTSFYSHTE